VRVQAALDRAVREATAARKDAEDVLCDETARQPHNPTLRSWQRDLRRAKAREEAMKLVRDAYRESGRRRRLSKTRRTR
jgi:hypothetical protein